MPQHDPDFGDIYGVAPVLINDKHRAPRRCAIAQAREDYVTVFGRTTQVYLYNATTDLLSDPEPACRLDKHGMYTTRHKYSVMREDFDDALKTEFYGALGTASYDRFLDYWERQLGLR